MGMADQQDRTWDKYILILRRALRTLPVNNVKTRRRIYERAEQELKEMLTGSELAMDPEEFGFHHRLLRTTVRLLENDIRAGVDIFSESYTPNGLGETARKLAEARDIRISRKRAALAREARLAGQSSELDILGGASPDQVELIAHLRKGLMFVGPIETVAERGAPTASRLIVIHALLIHQFQLIASQSRIAVLWLLIQPAVVVMLISLIYFIMETHFILNMDIPTFALLGSTTWIMCRQVIFRVSTGLVSNRSIINLPPVRPIHAAITQGVLYLIIYMVVFVLLLSYGHVIGLTTLPNNIFKVVVYIGGMWFFSFGLGLIFGGIAAHWLFFLRFAAVLERALQLFSSVFFVSEQLPEDYKHWVLWCPTLHGMQLLREAYFPGYVSTDASLRYFWMWLVVIVGVGLLLEKAVRPRIQPL